MAEEALEKASGILPEAWYDLIVRIVPGALVTLLTIEKLPSSSNQLGGLILALVVFYVVGIFLDVFSEWTIGRLRRRYGLKDTSGLDEEIWRQRNKLRPSQWQVVSKLFAEADMFKALAAYSLIQLFCETLKVLFSLLRKWPLDIRIDGVDLSNLRILPLWLSIPLFFSAFGRGFAFRNKLNQGRMPILQVRVYEIIVTFKGQKKLKVAVLLPYGYSLRL